MRTKHYDTAVSTLIQSIQDFWVKDSKDKLELDKDFDFASHGGMDHDWQHTVTPQKRNSWRNGKIDAEREARLNKAGVKRHNERVSDFVVNNVYREHFGLPTNLEVREPDVWIKKAVKDSYVAERTRLLQKYSIDPNLGNQFYWSFINCKI